ncbi:transmembrane serine/threonine protein kinase D [Streptomyces bingchenggensis BCW-1]|uniref:non-specific serine/threonine protein kinase n=1 Tax=Streptomyces bingchenggensis (strain BCW-1) TaxID=749414 RepID=D7BQS5_STRBB|nr:MULTISPECIES: PQQ-binding-like beta-propeller repeat protein [Streptomyces]ADI09292.1 transmembrane serine/threonine protein kinase D [Streptomyces bingchenggensis BCW-1]
MVARVLVGRYELVRFVGRGGMGEVWEGRDRVIGRRVAVKLLPHDRGDTTSADLFRREANTAGALNHPAVVTVHDFGEDEAEGSLFLVMELLEGRNLATVLREDGPPPVATAVDWVAQAAAGLTRAHEADVIHRDLKPANLHLAADGRVKILDFGIARFMEALPSSKVMGTFPYMPPERFDGHSGEARSDLYSLGCVLHELLTGKLPFDATSAASMMSAHLTKTPVPPGRIRPGVPAALDELVMELLAKAPEDRPASAAQVHDRLRALSSPAASASSAASGPSLHDMATRTADAGDARDITPAGPASPATADAATATAGLPPTRVAWPTPRRAGFVTRRRALWLGAAAIAAGAGIPTGFALLDDGASSDDGKSPDHGTSASGAWFAAGGQKLSPPVVDGKVVYIKGQDLQDATVYALDGATGKKKWSYRLKDGGYGQAGANEGDSLNVPTPAVIGGAVYVMGTDDKLCVLDAVTGKKKWDYAPGGSVTWLTAVGGMVQVYVSDDEAIHSLDAATGTEKWATRRGIIGVKDYLVAGDGAVHVYIDGKGDLRALDAATGSKKWELTGRWADRLWTAGGLVYTRTVVEPITMYALDAATGARKWEFVSPTNQFAGGSSSAHKGTEVVGGVAYVVGTSAKDFDERTVHALDSATGKQKWSERLGDDLGFGTLTAIDRALYVRGRDQTYALNVASGKTEWSITSPERQKLVGAGKVVYVSETADNPHVQALHEATGTKKWGSAISGNSLRIGDGVLYVVSKNKEAVYALDTATGARI